MDADKNRQVHSRAYPEDTRQEDANDAKALENAVLTAHNDFPEKKNQIPVITNILLHPVERLRGMGAEESWNLYPLP